MFPRIEGAAFRMNRSNFADWLKIGARRGKNGGEPVDERSSPRTTPEMDIVTLWYFVT